jgi:integrase
VKGHELAELDISEIDLQSMIVVKPTPKRTNRSVFFDPETLEALDWCLSPERN